MSTMATTIIVLCVITWLFGVLVTESNATTCTPLTQNTCAQSLWMTGVCSDGGVCECRHPDVYVPGPFGCQEQQAAYIETETLVYRMKTWTSQSLRCSPRSDDDSYLWYLNGELEEDQHGRLFPVPTEQSGTKTITCKSTIAGVLSRMSDVVTISVEDEQNTMGEVQVIASAEGFLRNGYFSLTCDFKTVNTRSPVTYTWRKGYEVIPGVTDKTLQFNSFTGDDVVDYSCIVNGEDGMLTSELQRVTFDPASRITSDTPSISSNVDAYGIGNNAIFTCKIKYLTPGAVFTWKVDDDVQEGQESQHFTFTPTSRDPIDIKCRYTFGGVLSPETIETINPKYLMSTSLHNDHGYLSSTLLTPVTSTIVSLYCDVTLSLSAGDANDVTYQWLKDDEEIEGATSQDYVVTADAGAPATIKCAATINDDTTTSDGVTISTQGTAAGPIVSLLGASPSLGSDVSLYCVSHSDAQGATFEWKKDAQVIPGATKHFYQIKSLEASDTGDYSCTITVGGDTSAESEAFHLEKLNQCKWASDCTEEGMDVTICDEGMCRCVPGLVMENFQCVHVTAQIFIGDLPSPSTLTPVASTSVKLSCHAPRLDNDETVTYQWTEIGSDVWGSTSRDHVHKAGDVGTSVIITCTATTSAGTVTSAGVTVIVQGR